MTTWIRRPPDQADQRWHLRALLPSPVPLLFSACGLRWTESRSYGLEEIEDQAQVPMSLRCLECEALFRRQAK